MGSISSISTGTYNSSSVDSSSPGPDQSQISYGPEDRIELSGVSDAKKHESYESVKKELIDSGKGV
jgi:hypothetical protein